MKALSMVLAMVLLGTACAAPKRVDPPAPALRSAQASEPVKGVDESGNPRVDAIWNAANDRVVQQLDAWFDEGDFPACIQLLKVQVEMYPHDYDIATNLGWMDENVERWTDAEAEYDRFRAQNPKDPDGPLALADYYFRRKRYDEIPALLEPTLTMSPHPHPNVWRILAHSYDRLKRYSDAVRVWDAYIAVAPNDLAAKANRARVAKKLETQGSGR